MTPPDPRATMQDSAPEPPARGLVVLAFGGREFTDRRFVFAVLDAIHRKHGIRKLIAGGARGADRLAEEWADARGVDKDIVPAEWEKHGKAAGPIRNQVMADRKPDVGVGFPGGRGTADMKDRLERQGTKVWEPEYKVI